MSHIVILDEPLCAAGAVQRARIRPAELVACTWSEAIGGNRGTLSLTLAANGPSVPLCALFDVVRVYDSQIQRAWQYRITRIVHGPHLPTVQIEATDLSHDLGRTRLSDIEGGVEKFSFGDLSLTPEQWIDTLVIPSLVAAGKSWIVKGPTITPVAEQPLNIAQSTCGAVMAALESATKFEWWLEPNGDTNYRIMLGRRTAAGTPRMWVGKDVIALEREIIGDEKFFNRAIAQGATVGDETERSGIAQHGWKIDAVSGDDITLEHPQAGGTAPIGSDDQLNGTIAGVSIDGVIPPRAMSAAAVAVAWDAPRQTVWWVTLRPGSLTDYDVAWHSYATGVSGRIQVGGAVALREIVIDATRAELFVACNDADKVERIDLVTRASVGNIAVGVGPTTLTNLRAMGIAELAVGYGGSAGPDLYSLATLAFVAAIDDLNGDGEHHVIYDSGSTRYVTFCGSNNVSLFNAAHAQVGVTLDAGFIPLAANIAAGVIQIVGPNDARTLTVATATLGALVALPAGVGATAWVGLVAPLLSGKIYVYDGTSLVALNTAAAYAVSGRVNVLGGLIHYDATDDVFLVCSGASLVTALYRNGNITPSGRLRFAVQDTVVATQEIEKPAATKGPLIVGQQLVEFRADAQDTYRPHLEDPVSVAVYGPVDGYPAFKDGYKRNYKLDPRLDAWTSDGVFTRPRWLGFHFGDTTNVASVGDLKWSKADAPASRATAALVNDGGTWTVNVVDTLAIDGLPAGYVVHAGALLSYSNDTALAVLDRAVASGGGAVTLSVLPLNTKVIVNNDPITVHQPAETDALGDFMLGAPIHDIVDGRWPLIAGAVHLPSIGGATQAWIRFRYLALRFGGNTNAARVDFGGYDTGNISGPNATAGALTAPVWSDLVLEKQVALNTVLAGTDHFLEFRQVYAGADVTSRKLHLWLKAIEVFIVSAAQMPTPAGAITGDELVPWVGSNYLLFEEARSSPSFHYRVEFIERPATPTLVGQTAELRDPPNGIAATPRISEIAYDFPRDESERKRPRITLQNRVPSAMEALAGVGT